MKRKFHYLITPVPKGFSLNVLWGTIITVILTTLFLGISSGVRFNSMVAFDNYMTETIRQLATPTLTQAVIWGSYIGSGGVVALLASLFVFVLAFVFKRRWDALGLFISCLGGWLINKVLKMGFQRARPEWKHWVVEEGFSFPSGQAMMSTVFYGMLGYLIWVNVKEQKKPAAYVLILTVMLILCIGLSRIYLGVHYTTDVLGGFTAGGAWLISTIMVIQWLRDRKQGKR